jgi:hypothetical protein
MREVYRSGAVDETLRASRQWPRGGLPPPKNGQPVGVALPFPALAAVFLMVAVAH